MLHGRTIRTTIPCGRIKDIRYEFDTAGFTICDHRDIPGRNIVSLIVDDQPCLVEREVRHVAEPVVLLAHESRDALLGATVAIDYEPAAPVFDPMRSDKVLKELLIEKGNLNRGFANADVIVEGVYRTGHQEHVYIETNGVIAVPEKNGITVYGSIQCPFYVDRALRVLLGPERHVRVVQTETGGGFGGKEEYPSMLACHATLLALKASRPVKIVYDRVEDMLATTKRHPSIVRHRTGVKKDGRITAMDVDVAKRLFADASAWKRATQPLSAASAGCVFKNPFDSGRGGPRSGPSAPSLPSAARSAGALIDGAGLKGERAGHAVVSPLHANFIVNEGGASFADVHCLRVSRHTANGTRRRSTRCSRRG